MKHQKCTSQNKTKFSENSIISKSRDGNSESIQLSLNSKKRRNKKAEMKKKKDTFLEFAEKLPKLNDDVELFEITNEVEMEMKKIMDKEKYMQGRGEKLARPSKI